MLDVDIGFAEALIRRYGDQALPNVKIAFKHLPALKLRTRLRGVGSLVRLHWIIENALKLEARTTPKVQQPPPTEVQPLQDAPPARVIGFQSGEPTSALAAPASWGCPSCGTSFKIQPGQIVAFGTCAFCRNC